jgi:hypothetical protein
MRDSDGVVQRKMPRPRALETMPVYLRADVCATSRWPDASSFAAIGRGLGRDDNLALVGAQRAGCLVNWS